MRDRNMNVVGEGTIGCEAPHAPLNATQAHHLHVVATSGDGVPRQDLQLVNALAAIVADTERRLLSDAESEKKTRAVARQAKSANEALHRCPRVSRRATRRSTTL